MRMFTGAYSARSDSSVVNEPAPAISGKTTGTSVASLMGPMFLKISMSRIISTAMRKMTKAPATAKLSISTLKSCSTASPAKKKPVSNEAEMSVAFVGLTGRPFCLRSMMIGVEPSTSMTAKSTMKALAISCQLHCESTVCMFSISVARLT